MSWLLIQVVETLFPVFGLPDAAIRAVVIVFAIGLVPAVAVAWAFELTPDGLVRDAEVDRASPSTSSGSKRLDRIALVALALAVGYFAFDKFLLDPARDAAIAEAAREQGRAEATQVRKESGPPVLAVLPFTAVTDNEDSAFFAAGVHDDLLTKLARLPAMLVISRTSVLEYKDVQRNIREIGEALGADAILEGGVQSAGGRIRINAQLIDARTDQHLWAETYDRELTTASLFDVQDDISQAIAQALQVTMSATIARSPVPTSEMAAYRAYHEALAFRDSSHAANTTEAYRQMLLKAAELDPSYTRPLAELVGSLALGAFTSGDAELIGRAEQALSRIEAVAPGSADHLIAQAYYTYYVLKDYDLAHELVSQALAMTPSDERLVEMRSWIERRQGDYDAMIESLRLARRLDPRNPRYTGMLISNLAAAHRYDAAEAVSKSFGRSYYWAAASAVDFDFRRHRDTARLEADYEALRAEFGDEANPTDLWQMQLLNRNLPAVKTFLDTFPGPEERSPSRGVRIPGPLTIAIMAAWMLGDDERLDALVDEARAAFEADREETGGADGQAYLGLALLAAVQGNRQDTERLVRRWERTGGLDWPIRVSQRNTVCQILGIAGAAEAAVDCIRTGLEEPSYVMPFLEPLWPFYDPIREAPEFVALVAELEGSMRE